MQKLAKDLEELEDPSIGEVRRDQLEKDVEGWKGYI